MANTIVLQQDECAPDSLESFKEEFKKMFMDFDLFIEKCEFEQIDEWTNVRRFQGIKMYWSADFPFYSVMDTNIK